MMTQFHHFGAYGLVVALAPVMVLGPHPDPYPEEDQEEAPAQAEEKPTKSPPPITLTVRTDKTEYCLMEPIVLELELTNHSDNGGDYEYRFFWGSNGFDGESKDFTLHIEVTQGGEKVPYTRLGPRGGGGGVADYAIVPPGKARTWRFLINAAYDMTLEGEYVISGSIPIMGPYGDPNRESDGFLLEAEPIRVTVKDCPF